MYCSAQYLLRPPPPPASLGLAARVCEWERRGGLVGVMEGCVYIWVRLKGAASSVLAVGCKPKNYSPSTSACTTTTSLPDRYHCVLHVAFPSSQALEALYRARTCAALPYWTAPSPSTPHTVWTRNGLCGGKPNFGFCSFSIKTVLINFRALYMLLGIQQTVYL